MSVHYIYYKDGAKMMRPVLTREEYMALRDSEQNRRADKRHMVQMNYSAAPSLPPRGDGKGEVCEVPLKGCKTPGNSVGMDIDLNEADNENENKTHAIRERILAKTDELGLLMLEQSATKGYHIVFRRHPEMTQEENLKWASNLLGVEYDKGAKDITRVFYTPADKLLYIDDSIFLREEGVFNQELKNSRITDSEESAANEMNIKDKENFLNSLIPDKKEIRDESARQENLDYCGIGYDAIVKRWWKMYNDGQEPVKSNRNTLTFELAVNLRHICGFDRDLLDRVIPCYDGFSQTEKMACIDSALGEKRTQMPKRLKDVLMSIQRDGTDTSAEDGDEATLDEVTHQDDLYYYNMLPKMPMGVSDSIGAVGPQLSMPVMTAICPAIGALATGVELDVHGRMRNLNLISYIAGDFGSGKGDIDPVIAAWMGETKALDKMYEQQEEEWRAKKRAAKNKKEQPEEPKLPVRCLTLNNTVANLAERLSNTEGKHGFSFTPEADTLAQKWRSSMCDFSVMIRQSYDGSSYEREARSADAVNVHIDKLLWNITMCGTPDALYRVVNNYTDGFQSRIAVARTPDNTFSPLEKNTHVLTDIQKERIGKVAHLLPLMVGQVVLPKLEAKGREWVEGIRLETMKNDDKVRARQRFRVCVTTQRMVCCLMLCKVCDELIRKHGLSGAELRLKQDPMLWKRMVLKTQTSALLGVYDIIANYLLENALYFFRDRIEAAFSASSYSPTTGGDRCKRGKNDSIYERLAVQFTFEQAYQQSVAVKGASITRNSVQQMLKNWRNQQLIQLTTDGVFVKK